MVYSKLFHVVSSMLKPKIQKDLLYFSMPFPGTILSETMLIYSRSRAKKQQPARPAASHLNRPTNLLGDKILVHCKFHRMALHT